MNYPRPKVVIFTSIWVFQSRWTPFWFPIFYRNHLRTSDGRFLIRNFVICQRVAIWSLFLQFNPLIKQTDEFDKMSICIGIASSLVIKVGNEHMTIYYTDNQNIDMLHENQWNPINLQLEICIVMNVCLEKKRNTPLSMLLFELEEFQTNALSTQRVLCLSVRACVRACLFAWQHMSTEQWASVAFNFNYILHFVC